MYSSSCMARLVGPCSEQGWEECINQLLRSLSFSADAMRWPFAGVAEAASACRCASAWFISPLPLTRARDAFFYISPVYMNAVYRLVHIRIYICIYKCGYGTCKKYI